MTAYVCAAGKHCYRQTRSKTIDRWRRWRRWTCALCKRSFHWECAGGADDYPELCDDCWSYVIGPDGERDDGDDAEHARAGQTLRIMRRLEAPRA